MNNSNQRLLLTVAICMAVAIVWSLLFQPKPRPHPVAQPPAQTQTRPETPQPAAPAAAAAPAVPRGTSAARAPTRKVAFDSEKLHVVVSSDGAALESAQLKGAKFTRHNQGTKDVEQVDLISLRPGEPLPLSTVIRDAGGAEIVPADASYELVEHDERSATFRTQAQGAVVTKKFSLDPRTYRLDLSVDVHAASALNGQLSILSTGVGHAGGGGGFFSSHANTPARAICKAGGKLERVGVGDKHPVWEGPGPAAFVGIDEQYFIRAVVPPAGVTATCRLESKPEGDLVSSVALPITAAAGGDSALSFIVYAGPKDTDQLAAVAQPLTDSVDLGFWSVIASVLLAVMKFFYRVVPPHNWGIAIILLTLTVKILTFPLQHKSMKSMQEMQRLQPQIEELKKKFAGDQQRQNLEQMKLFREHGVNPMGSCLPMLIQMPIWLALYTTLQVSVELYNSVFIPGWLEDLTAKDPYYVLPVAMGITMLLTQVLTPTPMSNPSQKTMGYAMSVFFSFLMLNLPSGLTLYIFVNNVLSIIQQMYLRRAMRNPTTGGGGAQPPGRERTAARSGAGGQAVAVSPRRA
jgi:YidC/Oxa1 family membrane protein insertase